MLFGVMWLNKLSYPIVLSKVKERIRGRNDVAFTQFDDLI